MEKSPQAFKTISEVAKEIGVPQHVLRFWETRFNQIKPLKRGGARRYYRPEDVMLLGGIKQLLYEQGYTIKGVKRILKEQGVKFVASVSEGDNLAQKQMEKQHKTAMDVKEFVEQTAQSQPQPMPQSPTQSSIQSTGQPQSTTPQSQTQPTMQNQQQNNAQFAGAVKEVLGELLECKRLLDQTR